MTQNSTIKAGEGTSFFPEKREWQWLILGFLIVAALAIRLYGINEYPMDSHPIKQYRSALTARVYYYENDSAVPEWQKEVALANVQYLGELGPTIVEHLAAFAFWIAGGEKLWIPRLFSAFFWLVGGIFIYLIALDLSSSDAAIISAAFYLFLPPAVIFSQNFQPDPLMIMLMIMSLFFILKHHQSTSTQTLIIAAVVSAVVMIVKPVSLFFIFGAFLSLAIYRHGVFRLISKPDPWVFSIVSLLPTVVYYGYGLFISDSLQGQASTSFIPALLLDISFWQFWLKHIYRVIGFGALIGAMFGTLLFPADWRRSFILGLWLSYLAYGVVFTYHIHTHDYYQLPFVPVIALSLGPLGALLLQNLQAINPHRLWRIGIGSILLLAVGLNMGLVVQARNDLPDFDVQVRLAEEIGEAVEHSTQTLILAPNAGSPLKYHGQFAGWPWPTVGDINSEELIGIPKSTVDARLSLLADTYDLKYFIVTDFDEYNAQEDLKEYLPSTYPVLLQGDDYIIFDLRQSVESG